MIEHVDEEHPHIHAFILPLGGPGCSARHLNRAWQVKEEAETVARESGKPAREAAKFAIWPIAPEAENCRISISTRLVSLLALPDLGQSARGYRGSSGSNERSGPGEMLICTGKCLHVLGALRKGVVGKRRC